jgi:ribosome assembly protein 4
MSSHTAAVTAVKWGGEGLIYSAARDCTINVWAAEDGRMVRSLKGHGHWVNTMSLSTDYALKTGAFDHKGSAPDGVEEARAAAQKRYETAKGKGTERLATGSDDFTLCLWEPGLSKTPVARMTGHQQLVNQVCFSPDGRWVLSASFDKSVRVWDGVKGTFVATLRGHVGPVYQVRKVNANCFLFVQMEGKGTGHFPHKRRKHGVLAYVNITSRSFAVLSSFNYASWSL